MKWAYSTVPWHNLVCSNLPAIFSRRLSPIIQLWRHCNKMYTLHSVRKKKKNSFTFDDLFVESETNL